MISHKPLKSIAHNFGHSLISMMNYIVDDYFLGHLLKQARITRLNKLEIDILNKKAGPVELLTDLIQASIVEYCNWFPNLVQDSGSSMQMVKSAKVTIEFDLESHRPYPFNNAYAENPYVCEVEIIEDRGKKYSKKQEGWWFPEEN